MGSQLTFKTHPTKNMIMIEKVHEQLSSCQELATKQCQVYGVVHELSYHGLKFMVCQTEQCIAPDSNYLHYFVQPNLLVIPHYTLLENYGVGCYNKEVKLLKLVKEVAELCSRVEVGLGRNKLGKISDNYSPVDSQNQWKIVGLVYNNPYWNYQAISRNPNIYVSPELMKAYSKQKLYPKINIHKSDVFILGIMLLEILAQQTLIEMIYNYSACEIKLKPILAKLAMVQENYSEFTYRLFVRMLEFEPEDRIAFQEIIRELSAHEKNRVGEKSPSYMSNELGNNNFTPLNSKPQANSPFLLREHEQKANEVRRKCRSPGVIRKNIPTSENSLSVSPSLSHDRVFNRCKLTPAQFNSSQPTQSNNPRIQPFGLIHKNRPSVSKAAHKSGNKFKTIRS